MKDQVKFIYIVLSFSWIALFLLAFRVKELENGLIQEKIDRAASISGVSDTSDCFPYRNCLQKGGYILK